MMRKLSKTNRFFVISSLIAMISSFVLIFVGGLFASETTIDEIANYTAEVVKNKSDSGTYLGTIVEPNGKDAKLPDSVTEFNGLYGVFRQEKATFGALFNADKKTNISFVESESSDLSIFCLGPNGTISYKNHYKHYIYPFEMLFADESYYDVSKYVAYLSTSQANDILTSRGISKINDEYTLEQYEKLLGTKTELLFNGTKYEYVIGNVFIESNYYYDCFVETFGNFFLTSYFAPEEVAKQHIYFLTSYVYQNKFFMNYLNKIYDSTFKMSFSTLNYRSTVDIDRILTFRSAGINNTNVVFVIFCVLSALITLIGYYLFYRIDFQKRVALYVVHVGCLFVPYLIFKLVFLVSHNIKLFSTVSSIADAVLIISGLIFYSFTFFKKKYAKVIKTVSSGEIFYEVSI